MLHDKFANLVRYHGTKTFGCDDSCLDDCLERRELITFWEIPVCVSHCDCHLKNLVNVIERRGVGKRSGSESLNIPHLMKDSGYDKHAWGFFIKNRDEYI